MKPSNTKAKTSQETEQPQDAKVVPLQQFYLGILAAGFAAQNLTTLQYEIPGANDPAGSLYFIRAGTTAAEFVIAYQFLPDSVKLKVVARSGKALNETVSYVGGLDGFLVELSKFLNAGRLGHTAS